MSLQTAFNFQMVVRNENISDIRELPTKDLKDRQVDSESLVKLKMLLQGSTASSGRREERRGGEKV